MVHFWPIDPTDRKTYGTEIPIWENYILWALQRTNYRFAGANEYLEPDRVLKRGYGLCSQHALLISNILTQEGYQSKLIQLSGHIVATVEDKEEQWSILDADYGVFMPHSIQYVEKNTHLVDVYYQNILSQVPENIRLPMKYIYGSSEDNLVVAVSDKVGTKGFYIIKFSSYAIWAVPFVLILFPMLTYMMLHCRGRNEKRCT